jgi:hypothetical protein
MTWKGDNMKTMSMVNGKAPKTIVRICLLAILLTACGSQPDPMTENAPPTQEPPSPTKTPPPTPTPETPAPVTTYEQLIGSWLSVCGAGACTLEFKTDGTYRAAYVKQTESGITTIETGKVTFADGILHFVSAATGYCVLEGGHPNGDYTAVLFHLDNNLYLRLTPAPNDECTDRKDMYARDMKFLGG